MHVFLTSDHCSWSPEAPPLSDSLLPSFPSLTPGPIQSHWFHQSSIRFGYPSVTSSEKAMAAHSSTRAWKSPWTEEPGRLQSMGPLRVGHDWVTSLSISLSTFMHGRRKRQPIPVFLPGESQRQGSLVGCHLWDLRVWHDWHDLAAAAAKAHTGLLLSTSQTLRVNFLTCILLGHSFTLCIRS